MAAPNRTLRRLALHPAPQHHLFRTRPRRALRSQIPRANQTFHTTCPVSFPRQSPSSQRIPIPRSNLNAPTPPAPAFPHNLSAADQAYYRNASAQEKAEFESAYETLEKRFSEPSVIAEIDAEINRAAEDVENDLGSDTIATPKIQLGLLNMGEEDEIGDEEDEEFEGNDVSSLAHGELEQHREIREYARIAAWELPLLSKLAKPYEPPSRDHPLRFRYTSYMGETHPAAKKVVLEFCPGDLHVLSPAQRLKLIKLSGPRYDPRRDLVKMSCEMFETQAQNKRYLGDIVDSLVDEAQTGDTFDDVPVDFRHVDFHQKPVFPREWGLPDEAARQAVRLEREEREAKERERARRGKLVDGGRIVERVLKLEAGVAREREASKVLVQRKEREPVSRRKGVGLRLGR